MCMTRLKLPFKKKKKTVSMTKGKDDGSGDVFIDQILPDR